MTALLDIDPDILAAAEVLAAQKQCTAGKIISDLARRGITGDLTPPPATPGFRNGFEVLPAASRTITPDLIEKLLSDTEHG